MPCVRTPWLTAIAAVVLAYVASCGALAAAESGPQRAAQEAAASDSNLRAWDDKWRKLETAPESVSLKDHWRVCDLKFRFRNYRDLFRCLELIEQRVSKLDENTPQRLYTPVLVGWMRGSAFAELGEIDEALKWSESAWQALPKAYRDDPASVLQCRDPAPNAGAAELIAVGALLICRTLHKDDFQPVVVEAGGFRATQWSGSDATVGGISNPAGLDMRPQTIAMSLAAQRSVLHLQRGDAALARDALQDLNKWRLKGPNVDDVTAGVSRFAMGPLFGLGDYAAVIENYRRWARWMHSNKATTRFANILFLGMPHAVNKLLDFRKFVTALEDASTEYLYATSLARLGQTELAEKTLDAMLAASELHDMGSIYWAVLYERSQLALKRGQRADAIRLLQQAVDAIERVRTSINFESGKIGFAADKQTVYAALVSALAESGDWRGAFQAAERAKARALVDLLAQVHELAPPPAASEKVRQLLASAQVNDGQMGFPVSAESVETRGRVFAARDELPRVAPETASLVSVQTASLADIASKLTPGERLLDYFRAGDSLYAFILNGPEVEGFKLAAEGLDEQIRAFRTAIEAGDPTAAEAGRALYERLLRPLAGEIPGPSLTVSPHGALHYLPFAALQDGAHYLIDRYSLRVMPSASALAYLKTDTPAKAGKLLALGNPDLGDARFDLPNAEREAQQVAQLFPASRALVRQQASKTAVKEMGSSFAILHFASHARFEPDSPLNSGLYLARGNEADGRLTVSDLYGMRLDVQLVTLSACETGMGKLLSGDDVMGLTRGFLYAGARSIVASLWPVDDAATAELMISFYQHLSSDGPREALRLAQMQTRQKHPEPRLWAAFEITGRAD
jgi:CHAT domain-containing protein